jgi:arsenate reductase
MTKAAEPLRVLVLCTHNSARSQIAEGWFHALGGAQVEVESAGTEATQVNPLAIRAMAEVGVDLSAHTSKHLNQFLTQRWDYVITVCNQAAEACPFFPGATHRLHWDFTDPSKVTGSEEERLQAFRQTRDLMRKQVAQFLEGLQH